jgi:putative hydrolase of the HAD superfamily
VRLDCEAVIFDLDDTLLDHRGAARDALVLWASGWELGEIVEVERRWLEIERHYYGLFQARKLTMVEQRRARVRAFLPHLGLDDDAADTAFGGYWSAYRRHWRPFADAAGVIERALAAGVTVGVLTNGEHEHQVAKLEATGLARREVRLIASSQLPAAKPDPRAFTTACAMLGVPAGESCVMVGDSWENDIEGASGAGLRTVFVDRHDTRPDSTVPRLRSLADLHFAPA